MYASVRNYILTRIDINTAIVALLAFLLLTWLTQWYMLASKLPPGPIGLPILGCVPKIFFSGKSMHDAFSDISAKYGSVSSLYLGRTLVIIFDGYDAVKEAFHNPCLSDRPHSAIFEETFEGQGITFNSGQSWSDLRQFSSKVLRSFGVGKKSYEDHITNEAQYLLEYIAKQNGDPYDPTDSIHNAVTNNICSVLLGSRFEYDDPKFLRLIHCLDENTRLSGGSFLLNILPAAKLLFRKTQRIIVKNLNEYKSIFQPIIDEHRDTLNPNDLNDFISVFLNECKQVKESNIESEISEKHLLFILVQLFAAGTGTVATTLIWAMSLLMKHPDVQDKIHRELDAVVGRDRLPRLSDKKNLPYVEATLLEIGRYASIVPLSLPHSAGSETSVQGYHIPKGAIIIGSLYSVHYSKKYWQDPKEFNPERFLQNGEVFYHENAIPFSIGKRVCFGDQLGRMELFIFFTHMFHRFSMKKPEGYSEPPLVKVTAGRNEVPYKLCAIARE